eukprot:GHRQ01038942.1.p1 GENE.GHRQ01038942.1~~GHRQ01038942.1.p1  ORF type:complete len:128 (-),score=23.75 GHRQ01038942.1:155-538(-)
MRGTQHASHVQEHVRHTKHGSEPRSHVLRCNVRALLTAKHHGTSPHACAAGERVPVLVWIQRHVLGAHCHALHVLVLAGDVHQEGQHVRVACHQLPDVRDVEVHALADEALLPCLAARHQQLQLLSQ